MSGSSTSFTIDTGAYGIQEGRQPPSTGAPEPSPSVIKHRVIHLFVPPTLEVNAVAAMRIPLVSPKGVKSLFIAYPLKMAVLRQWKLDGGGVGGCLTRSELFSLPASFGSSHHITGLTLRLLSCHQAPYKTIVSLLNSPWLNVLTFVA